VPGLSEVDFHTNETIFSITRKPGHLAILGAGPIGMELAQAFARLGVQVTVIEAAEPLGREDPELAAITVEALLRDGVTLRTGARVSRVERRGRGVRVVMDGQGGEDTVDASDILVAAGRRPTVDGLDLEKAGVSHDGEGIRVDRRLRTTNRRVYAVGDVAGGPQFTHVANYHAGIAIRNILFRLRAKVDYSHVPRITFTAPELAQVGMTEAEARAAHRRVRILRWPYAENDRARADRETQGHIKVVTTHKGRILGAGIVGAQAGELIQVWSLAIQQGLDIKAMTALVPPYPTLGEISRRAAIEFYRPDLTRPLVRRIIGLLRLFG
jgi:pyruvate/2-oxoglutarate dehydrogenase complex dihydrolipoamide dehydrogenase (E3) component